jgi:hypothetical protein
VRSISKVTSVTDHNDPNKKYGIIFCKIEFFFIITSVRISNPTPLICSIILTERPSFNSEQESRSTALYVLMFMF